MEVSYMKVNVSNTKQLVFSEMSRSSSSTWTVLIEKKKLKFTPKLICKMLLPACELYSQGDIFAS